MANVEFPEGIKGVSGTLCKTTIRTRDGIVTKRVVATYSKRTGKQRIYLRISDSSKRTTPVTQKERAQRIAFTNAAGYANKIVKDRESESFMSWYNIWKARKMMFQGKTYATLRGFIMAYALAAIKAGVDINEQPDIPNL